MTTTEQAARTIQDLTDKLADATRTLADEIAKDPKSVTILIPSGMDALDNTLRQAALVLSTLGMASEARTDGFDFDPTPSPEGADRLVALAAEYAQKL